MSKARARLPHSLANSTVRPRPVCAKEGLSSLGRMLGQHGLRGGVATVCPTPADLTPTTVANIGGFSPSAFSLPGLAWWNIIP